MAAGRDLAPIYGAFGTTAVAAGLALCLRPDLTPSDPPVLRLAIGLALGTLVYAPLLRRFGATSLADVAATRFPISGAIRLGVCDLDRRSVDRPRRLSGRRHRSAGAFRAEALLGGDRRGRRSRPHRDARRPGRRCFVRLGRGRSARNDRGRRLPVGMAAGPLPFNPDGLFASANVASAPPQLLSPLVATMLAAAGFFAFAPAAVASRNVQSTIVSGLASVALCLVLAGLMGASTSAVDPGLGPNPSSPVSASLFGAAALAASLALAVLGIHAASRAFGVALADPPQPFPSWPASGSHGCAPCSWSS